MAGKSLSERLSELLRKITKLDKYAFFSEPVDPTLVRPWYCPTVEYACSVIEPCHSSDCMLSVESWVPCVSLTYRQSVHSGLLCSV